MTTFSILHRPATTRVIASADHHPRPRRVMAWIGLGIAAISAGLPVVSTQAQTTGLPAIVADFNKDGIPDALLPSTTTPTATIAFGSVPYGTFNANAKAVMLPAACTGPAAGAILVGDFNGDGFPDLAFFCGGGAQSSGVLLGNGDGTFAAAKTFAGAFSTSAVVGDFNHDGKLDLAVIGPVSAASELQGIQFFAGNGDGTFAAPVVSQFPSDASYSSPIAADVDQDGYPDIVLGSFGSDVAPTVNVFGNNKSGTFGVVTGGSSTPNASIAAGTAGSTTEQSILAGNFFGSGKPDLAVPDSGATPGIFVLQNTSSGGTFSFAAAVKTPYPALLGAMAGSFTGSGFSDLAVANGTTIAVLANDGSGNFSASYISLSIAFASPQFTVADANGDGYTDIYTAVSQNGAPQISVSLVSGSASATSLPVSLAIGTQAISAAWPGNVNFTGATAIGAQTVTGTASATALASSTNPSASGASVTFTAAVSSSIAGAPVPTGTVVFQDGATILGPGTLDPTGTAIFTTSALTARTHQLQASYGGDSFYASSVSAVLSQVVTNAAITPSLTWTNPAPIAYGTPLSATQLNAIATNANGRAIPGTYAYTPSSGTVLNPGVQALSVTFTPTDAAAYTTASKSVSLTVNAPPASVTLTAPPSTPPGSQPTVTFTIQNPYPVELTAVFTLTFAGAGTPPVDDPAIQFAAGGRVLTLVIPANSTTVPPFQLQSGTVAGTITVTPLLTAGGVDATPASLQPVNIDVPNATPVVKTVTMTQTANQLTVAMQGFSNTREISQASFIFTAAPGNSITTPDVTPNVSALFENWFSSAASIQYGSTFTYTQTFDISGNAAAIASVQVTLTNSVGASTPQTSQ